MATMTAAEIARSVRAKEISPREVLDETLARLEARNPSLNAFVHLDVEGARAAAIRLEERIMRGDEVGILAGVPTAMKDLFTMYPGWPSTFGGIPAFKSFLAPVSSHYPRAMEAAGAILIGSTNSPIFGFRGTCDNPLFGATRNPFDVTKNSGGSSGGSAAAVADGILAVGGGNDGGGSLRIPSAWCGTFGFQPSYGRLPQHGFDISPFVYEGAITRTVEDGALSLAALARHDRGDPFGNETSVDWTGALRKSVRGMKIGFSPDLGGYPVTKAVATRVAESVRAFEALGAEVIPVEVRWPEGHEALTELWCRLVGMRMAGALETFQSMGIDLRRDHPDDLPRAAWTWIDRAAAMSLRDVRNDQTMRTKVYEALQCALANVDVLACPTVACQAVDNQPRGTTVGPDRIEGVAVDPLIGWCLTYMTNLAGNPAASLPAGLVDGLPVGLQLIGQRYGDFDLLAACAAFERAQPWTDSYRLCENRPLSPV